MNDYFDSMLEHQDGEGKVVSSDERLRQGAFLNTAESSRSYVMFLGLVYAVCII